MSLNDPNWGRGGSRGPQGPGGGNQGPPDLDELWRSFNRRLNDLFGRRRRGNGGDEPPSSPPSGKALGGGAGALALLVLVVWLASGFYIVNEGTRGVVLTFGKFSQETQAGLRWRLPWPLQSHEIVNLAQVRTLEVGYRNNVRTKVLKESLMLTDDENIIDLQFAVQYLVKDPKDFIFNVRRPDESAMQIAETAVREVIGKHRMDAILYETQVDVANAARDLMQAIHDRYNTGIQVSTVTIQNAQPPEQVQAAFDDAVKAGQDRERQKNEGQAYANDVIPKARGLAARLLEEAHGYRQSAIARAEGDASRFKQVLAEYEKAPGVTRDRLYLDMMQQVLSSVSKVVVDTRNGASLFNLPLDRLMQLTTAVPAGAPEAATPRPAPEPSTSTESSSRGRDSLRRDRESR